MRIVLAVVLVASTTVAEEKPVTRVEVEVFTVGLPVAGSGERLRYVHARGELTGGQNPDGLAKSLAADSAPELAVIHSTSWRWEEDGRIVLTYLAWAKDGALSPRAAAIPALKPPGPTDPLKPRPKEIHELDPLAHGLRHVAFLARQTDGGVAAALGPRSTRVLLRFEPEVAGRLPEPSRR
jgi:hypothetical protein